MFADNSKLFGVRQTFIKAKTRPGVMCFHDIIQIGYRLTLEVKARSASLTLLGNRGFPSAEFGGVARVRVEQPRGLAIACMQLKHGSTESLLFIFSAQRSSVHLCIMCLSQALDHYCPQAKNEVCSPFR